MHRRRWLQKIERIENIFGAGLKSFQTLFMFEKLIFAISKVGCGAIGCELLKVFALMGVACESPAGEVRADKRYLWLILMFRKHFFLVLDLRYR